MFYCIAYSNDLRADFVTKARHECVPVEDSN